MGKTRAKTYGKQASIFNVNELAKYRDETPNPMERSYFHDEVDDFHHEKEKIPLSNVRSRDAQSSDEEVYKVNVDSTDEDEGLSEEDEEIDDGDNNVDDEAADDKDEAEDADLDDMKSDIEEDDDTNYLPSADNWGKRKKDFYNTDYVDKDYGGYMSESDEEAAKLEEIEAKTLQKRLTEHMAEEDFILGSSLSDTTANHVTTKKLTSVFEERIDVSKLSDEEKLKYVVRENPELLSLIKDFKAKHMILQNQLKPIAESLHNSTLPSTDRLNLLQLRFEAYSNYLLNLNFYLLLKAQHASLKNHPVIDRIMEWRKVVDSIDKKCDLLTDDLKHLSKALRKSNFAFLSDIEFIFDSADNNAKNVPSGSSADTKSRKRQATEQVTADKEFYDFENSAENDDGKRAATYEILKNKGTTPKRKKEDRNPRVKHRRKFQKALHRKRSQVPDVKRELRKYGGEERGIKANVVRSVKFR